MGVLQAVGDVFAKSAALAMEHDAIRVEQERDTKLRFDMHREFRLEQRDREAQRVDSLVRGEQRAGAREREGAAVVGRQKVAAAVNGVDSSTGSMASLQDSAAILSKLDAETERANARREALGFERAGRKSLLEFQQSMRQLDARADERFARGNRAALEWGGSLLNLMGGGMGGGK